MYGRRYGDRTLSFEASGALRDSALVMRDRETDSWWSIMSADAIGGPLEGTELTELPVGVKTTWGEWRSAHPETKVLSVDGVEHDDANPYARYFTSDDTFRGQRVDDDRLAAKAPIYAFTLDGTAYAVPHEVAESGALFPAADRMLYFHRAPGAPLFAGTEAWSLPLPRAAELGSGQAVREWLATPAARDEATRLPGFDTYWYTWVAAHPDGEILGPEAQPP